MHRVRPGSGAAGETVPDVPELGIHAAFGADSLVDVHSQYALRIGSGRGLHAGETRFDDHQGTRTGGAARLDVGDELDLERDLVVGVRPHAADVLLMEQEEVSR